MKRVGVLGSGNVGQALAHGLMDLGYEVAIGSRDAHVVDDWKGKIGTFAEVAKDNEILILCVKGSAAKEVVSSLKDHLVGKTILDTTNPIDDKPPEDGVLRFFTSLDNSLMEQLQSIAPDGHFIKAFNSVGSGQMVSPKYKEGQPTMFIAGDSEDAKTEANDLIKKLGWDIADMGSAKAARAIEPLCMLWCIPAILHGENTHALKLLTKNS